MVVIQWLLFWSQEQLQDKLVSDNQGLVGEWVGQTECANKKQKFHLQDLLSPCVGAIYTATHLKMFTALLPYKAYENL